MQSHQSNSGFMWSGELSSRVATLRKEIINKLSILGFDNTDQILLHLCDKIAPTNQLNNMSTCQKKIAEYNLLKILSSHLNWLVHSNLFIDLVSLMKLKAEKYACESALKLTLICKDQASLNQIHSGITATKSVLDNYLSENKHQYDLTVDDSKLDKILGYLLMLNLNKLSYLEAIFIAYSKTQFNLENKVYQHAKIYAHFVAAHEKASFDSAYSTQRRHMLYSAGLLETCLQRDPEEVLKYDAQMASSQVDKNQLLSVISEMDESNVIIVDIGPAGGATFRSVVAMSCDYPSKNISYVGVEYDKCELKNLNELLNRYTVNSRTPKELLKSAHFIEGNALELNDVLCSIKSTIHMNHNDYISIVLSSVIHEIYSYCEYVKSLTVNTRDIITMTEGVTPRCNPEVVYKVYYEAIAAVVGHPAGGCLNIRDGVMYKKPHELVTFVLHNQAWVSMFLAFLNDKKYAHLKNDIDCSSIKVGERIVLEAKFVQEFMLKAGWGPESFGNEINEVYCYLTLADHLKLLQRAAKELDAVINISVAKEYTQAGYKEHINDSRITILSGFNESEGFPPTNMILNVSCKR